MYALGENVSGGNSESSRTLLSIPFFYHHVSSNQEIINSKEAEKFSNFNDLIDQ